MARKRIRIPNLPTHIVRQWPSSNYKDIRTGQVYTIKALQAIYSNKTGNISTEQRIEPISPEMKHEQITNKRWDLNY